ncbi:MAG TPA: PilZ domain-containing protein [Terriglobales bacterium]|nr:PilZ domain-containing protein [Terriglobales bacterium]
MADTFTHAVESSYTRRWWRYRVNVPIRVIVRDVTKTTIVSGRAFSLSDGGMGMFAGTELNLGDQMAVEFTPPYSSPPIRVQGKICNRTGYNYGVEFVTESNSQKQDVAALCQHLSGLVATYAENL